MKPLWTQTLVWIAAAAVAFLFALASPDTGHLDAGELSYPAPAVAPRRERVTPDRESSAQRS